MADVQKGSIAEPVPKEVPEENKEGGWDNGGEGEESKAEDQKLRMDKFVFDDEKPKKKAKKSKPKPPKRPSKQEYETTIIELNGVLAGLRQKASKLDEVNYKYSKKLVNLHENRIEVSEHLKRVQKDHLQSLTNEEEYTEEIIKKRQDLETSAQVRTIELQKQYKQTESQLLGEMELLTTKLKTFRVFSDERDEMLLKLSNIEVEYKESDRAFLDQLYAMQQKNVIERNNTDNEAKARYRRVIDDFTQSREVRNAAYTRRLLSENSELRRKYDKLIPINLRKEQKLTRLMDKTCLAKETYTVVNDITKQLERARAKRDELIEKLKKLYNFYRAQVVIRSKYRRLFEAVKDREVKEISKYQNAEVMTEDVAKHTAKLHEKYRALKEAEHEYFYQKHQHDNFVDAVKAAAFSLCDLPEYRHLFPQSFREFVTKRDSIVRGLIEIITNVERKPESEVILKSKYRKGYLGLMPFDYVLCQMLKENSNELKEIPSYCQREIKYKTNQDDRQENLDTSLSDPGLQCLK